MTPYCICLLCSANSSLLATLLSFPPSPPVYGWFNTQLFQFSVFSFQLFFPCSAWLENRTVLDYSRFLQLLWVSGIIFPSKLFYCFFSFLCWCWTSAACLIPHGEIKCENHVKVVFQKCLSLHQRMVDKASQISTPTKCCNREPKANPMLFKQIFRYAKL